MSWEVWGPPIVVLLVGVVAGLVLALRSRPAGSASEDGEEAALRARKDLLMEQLKALEVDQDKLEAGEFAARREALVAEAALVLRSIDELANHPSTLPPLPLADAVPAGRMGARLLWAAGVLGFFVLLGVGLTEFSRPRARGETMTGGVGGGDGVSAPAAAPAPVSPEVQAARATLEENPNDLDALNTVSYDYLLKGELDEAMRTIDKARVIAPKDPGVLTHLAMLQLAVGMADRAVTGLEEAIQLRPDWSRPRLWMGLALLQSGQNQAAEASIQAAIGMGLTPDEQNFAMQLLAESRAPTAPMAAAAAAGGGSPPTAAASGGPTASSEPRVSGTISLAAGVTPEANQQVFLIVHRNAQGSGPPVAAKKLPASALPVDFSLGDADQMMGGQWPAEVWVFARLDEDGAAGSSDGDVESQRLGPLSPGTADIALLIGE